MKKIILSAILVLGVSTVYAKDDKKAADSSKNINFVAEAIERTSYVIEYDEKTGKAKVSTHTAKQPFLDVTHPHGWKSDDKKADKAIRVALTEYKKAHEIKKAEGGPATLGDFWTDFGNGFVIGFTAPIKLAVAGAHAIGL